jgi:hypothetical protein
VLGATPRPEAFSPTSNVPTTATGLNLSSNPPTPPFRLLRKCLT